jgi:GNAT superfamily N-acetyltransferase
MKEATPRRLQRPLRLYRRLRPVSSLRIEEIPLGDGRLKKFVDVPWHFYKNDPFWTPPLHADYLGSRLLGMTGLLTPEHPYHRTAEVTHFIAWRGRTPVGRISAAVNHRFNDYHNTAIGFFGHFELIDSPEVAEELLDKAQEWLSARGMAVMRGPGEYSCATHERQGVLIDGFDTPPTVELTHNPPYYAELLEGYGMRKAKDYHAYIVNVQRPRSNRLTELMERVKQRRNITTRSFSMAALRSEIRLVVELYNEAWADNWGFLPLTEDDGDSLEDTLKPILDEGLVRFAYVDGEPAAVLGAFPDPYYALRPLWKWYGDSDPVRLARLMRVRRHIPRIRLIFFGIKPKYRRLGVDAVLYDEVKQYAMKRGYQTCDISMLLEDNYLILRASSFMEAERYKTWRIYDLAL